jgi:hypothetical protein
MEDFDYLPSGMAKLSMADTGQVTDQISGENGVLSKPEVGPV